MFSQRLSREDECQKNEKKKSLHVHRRPQENTHSAQSLRGCRDSRDHCWGIQIQVVDAYVALASSMEVVKALRMFALSVKQVKLKNLWAHYLVGPCPSHTRQCYHTVFYGMRCWTHQSYSLFVSLILLRHAGQLCSRKHDGSSIRICTLEYFLTSMEAVRDT